MSFGLCIGRLARLPARIADATTQTLQSLGALAPALSAARRNEQLDHGRKSGRTYTTPVNYVRDGDELLAVGSRRHSWWKNLRGDAVVSVRVRGRKMRGEAEAFEGTAAEEGLLAVLRAVPAYRRYWKV